MTIDSLSRGQIAHETGHLLGFQHEHQRTNRDSFVMVILTNICCGNGFLYNIDTTSTTFSGANGHTYSFLSMATDLSGNIQASPTAAQATTTDKAVARILIDPLHAAQPSPCRLGHLGGVVTR